MGFGCEMGKKKTGEGKGKLGRYADTPEAMAMFRHLYEVPDNVGLKYVHWSNALNLATGDLLIPMVAIVEGGFASPWTPSWLTSLVISA